MHQVKPLKHSAMETKKSEKASLENKRLIFAEIGFVVALLVVYAGFETSTQARATATLIDTSKAVEEIDICAIPLNTPPPAPEVPMLPLLSDELEIVDDDFLVEVEFQSLDDSDDPFIICDYPATEVIQEDVEEDPIPFQFVETQPSFNGGKANEFSKWVNSRLVYPELCKELGVQGRVVLQFTIEKDGSLKNLQVLASPDDELSREAVRVVSSSPKWSPGKQRDQAVKVSYTFPVIFQLR